MTDITQQTGPASPAGKGIAAKVEKSLKRRYAAERRFRLYGLLAIGFAMLMLAILFTTIISNGIGAFVQTKATFDIALTEADIDPDGTADPEVIGRANFRSVVFDAIRAEFPSVSGRTDRRNLTGLLSSGADYELRSVVMENPGLIGQTVPVELTMADDADMFVKGKMTDVSETPGTAALAYDPASGTLSGDADVFGEMLADVKDELARKADERRAAAADAERQLDRIAVDLATARDRLAAAVGDEMRERAEEQVRNLEVIQARSQAELERAQAAASDFARRAEAAGGEEPLDNSMPSYLIAFGDGIAKVTSVAPDRVQLEEIAATGEVTSIPAGSWTVVRLDTPESSRRLTDKQIGWLWLLQQRDIVDLAFNTTFFTSGDSREPEQAGIWGAAVGSFFTLIVTLALSFPIGVMAAVYLEEFAPKNRWTDLIEVNINNLAAVPSIVFGLLGLAVFLNFFGLPRSAPLVGGLVLTLMTLPTIIIASRAALKSVPPSIREAALGMGASRIQMVTHHVLPLALPGMLTGTIIGMAQALGETAPLLMIGMVAFIVDIPGGPTDPATVLPVQIFLWADAPERAFVERTSAAIMVLLAFLIAMNLTAVLLRKKFEIRW